MSKDRDFSEKTVGEIVAEDYRVARVFQKYGIDYCCGGNQTLSGACESSGIALSDISGEIENVRSQSHGRDHDYNAWELSFLSDFIVNTHHAYLNANLVGIAANCNTIARVHGARHSELIKIAAIFDKIVMDMIPHLREEESNLFPLVKKAESARKSGEQIEGKESLAITESLEKLIHDHDEIGEAVHQIGELSSQYSLPQDACNTFSVTYQQLREFEDDLHRHVHLENNILFPKVRRLIG